MSDNYKPTSPTAQLGGAKRKNGHKSNCVCHICENMKNKARRGGYEEDAEKEQLKKMGGSKKKNGHKPNCSCPICKNMKNSRKNKKGGDNDESSSDEEESSSDEDEETSDVQSAGRKKKGNGHKPTCGCPICKNMRKSKKSKKGGEEPDIENQIGDEEEGQIKAQPSMINETPASNDEYDELDAAEKGESGPNKVGGTRKNRKSRKSNGHKQNCKCPICKNMKKGGKTRRHKKNSRRSH